VKNYEHMTRTPMMGLSPIQLVAHRVTLVLASALKLFWRATNMTLPWKAGTQLRKEDIALSLDTQLLKVD
jgi:hypothetical protein